MMWLLIFLWGVSEASWFIIIPDVILSLYAVRHKSIRGLFTANIICLAGAAIGGVIVYILSSTHHDAIRSFMLNLPAVHEYMSAHVHKKMAAEPFTAMVTGPLFGVPYKLFAVEAPNSINIILFVIFTIPARLIRFLIVSFLAYCLSHIIFPKLNIKLKIGLWGLVWILVYVIYFSIHPL